MRVRRSGTNFIGTFKIFSFHPHVHVYLAPFKLACRLQCIWLLRVKSVLLLDSCQTSSIELAKPQMRIQLNDHFCQNRHNIFYKSDKKMLFIALVFIMSLGLNIMFQLDASDSGQLSSNAVARRNQESVYYVKT